MRIISVFLIIFTKIIIHPSIYLHQATWPISHRGTTHKTDRKGQCKKRHAIYTRAKYTYITPTADYSAYGWGGGTARTFAHGRLFV